MWWLVCAYKDVVIGPNWNHIQRHNVCNYYNSPAITLVNASSSA